MPAVRIMARICLRYIAVMIAWTPGVLLESNSCESGTSLKHKKENVAKALLHLGGFNTTWDARSKTTLARCMKTDSTNKPRPGTREASIFLTVHMMMLGPQEWQKNN